MPIITLVWSWIGNVTLCPSDDVAIVQNTIWFDVDKEKIDERFLYYWFLDNQQLIVKLNRWSGQPSIRKTDILDLNLKLPELSYQKKVVSLLSRLDLKIELNNQINHNLYNMIQKLYESRFIKFEPFKNCKVKDFRFHFWFLLRIVFLSFLALI